MTFTDDDLARLKARKHPQRITKPLILSLLSRLEAAEMACEWYLDPDRYEPDVVKRWRKAAGR